MTAATPIPAPDEQEAEPKGRWVQPSFNRIDVREAEGADGTGTDGGLIS